MGLCRTGLDRVVIITGHFQVLAATTTIMPKISQQELNCHSDRCRGNR